MDICFDNVYIKSMITWQEWQCEVLIIEISPKVLCVLREGVTEACRAGCVS